MSVDHIAYVLPNSPFALALVEPLSREAQNHTVMSASLTTSLSPVRLVPLSLGADSEVEGEEDPFLCVPLSRGADSEVEGEEDPFLCVPLSRGADSEVEGEEDPFLCVPLSRGADSEVEGEEDPFLCVRLSRGADSEVEGEEDPFLCVQRVNKPLNEHTSLIGTHCITPSEMKGTKVLTLGAGREVLPHNMAVTKM